MQLRQPLIKAVVILFPTYTVAFATEAMVYTIPMLAVSTIFAHSIFDDAEVHRRTDDEDALESSAKD